MTRNDRERFVIPSCRLYQNEIGIHTFERLYTFSGPDSFGRVGKVWEFLTKKCKRYTHNHFQFSLCPGLRAEFLNNGVWHNLKLLVNPRVMVDGDIGYLRITDCQSDLLTPCRFKFNEYWQRHGLSFIKMEYCLVNRIDLCMGIEFLEPFSIPEYLDLLKRTPHKNTYHLLSLPNAEDERYSFKIANHRRGLVVYDKVYEQHRFSTKQDLSGLNLMRIEYQLYSTGLRKLGGQLDIVDRFVLFKWILDNNPEVMCAGIRSCLEITPYCSLERIKAELEKQTSWRASTKEKMIRVQQYLYHQGGYDSLVEEMRSRNKLPELQMVRERYRQLGFSPATLKKRSGRQYMPSLFMLALYVLEKALEE